MACSPFQHLISSAVCTNTILLHTVHASGPSIYTHVFGLSDWFWASTRPSVVQCLLGLPLPFHASVKAMNNNIYKCAKAEHKTYLWVITRTNIIDDNYNVFVFAICFIDITWSSNKTRNTKTLSIVLEAIICANWLHYMCSHPHSNCQLF